MNTEKIQDLIDKAFVEERKRMDEKRTLQCLESVLDYYWHKTEDRWYGEMLKSVKKKLRNHKVRVKK